MNKFLNQLKEYMINNLKDELPTLIPHFENLKEHSGKFKLLDVDATKWNLIIHYEKDASEGYTDGKFEISFWSEKEENPDHRYEIELLHDERYWGYCECSPDEEGYVEELRCCGDGCDWVAPRFSFKRIENLAYKSFDGNEKDMWILEKSWESELKEHKENVRKSQIKYIENQIKELEERRSKLL
jgi:hypothetical protein